MTALVEGITQLVIVSIAVSRIVSCTLAIGLNRSNIIIVIRSSLLRTCPMSVPRPDRAIAEFPSIFSDDLFRAHRFLSED